MNKGVLIGVGVLAAVAAVAFFVVQDMGSKTPKKSTPAVTQEETPPAPPTVTEGEVREIMVEGDEYMFSPKMIELTAGETVKITFKNMGKLPHNLVITELGVTTATIPGGQTDSVTVTADKSGMYSFFCSVGNHRQLGMEGRLEIK